MDKVIENLASLEWWVGIVVVGIVISLTASYLKPLVDSFLAKLSSSWRKRLERKIFERQQIVYFLSSSFEHRLMEIIAATNCRIRALMSIVFGLAFPAFTIAVFGADAAQLIKILSNIAFSVFFSMAFIEMHDARRTTILVFDATRKSQEPNNPD